jgi:hypothetical protein
MGSLDTYRGNDIIIDFAIAIRIRRKNVRINLEYIGAYGLNNSSFSESKAVSGATIANMKSGLFDGNLFIMA